jgi:hypothetical protein
VLGAKAEAQHAQAAMIKLIRAREPASISNSSLPFNSMRASRQHTHKHASGCQECLRPAPIHARVLHLHLAAIMAGVLECSVRTSCGSDTKPKASPASCPNLGGRSERVMRQLRCLRADDGAGLAEEDFHLAQAMLLQELRSDDECPVCLDYYDRSGQDAAVLEGCGHCLCVGCAAKWAASSATLDDSTTCARAIARTHVEAITCPMCNHVVSKFFIQLHQDGSYLSAGRWRRVNVAQLLDAYAGAQAAEEDSCWALVGCAAPPSPSIRVSYGNCQQEEDKEDTSDAGASSRCTWPRRGLDADREELEDWADDDALGWEGECLAIEDTLMDRQGRRPKHVSGHHKTPRKPSRREPLVSSLRRKVMNSIQGTLVRRDLSKAAGGGDAGGGLSEERSPTGEVGLTAAGAQGMREIAGECAGVCGGGREDATEKEKATRTG